MVYGSHLSCLPKVVQSFTKVSCPRPRLRLSHVLKVKKSTKYTIIITKVFFFSASSDKIIHSTLGCL